MTLEKGLEGFIRRFERLPRQQYGAYNRILRKTF